MAIIILLLLQVVENWVVSESNSLSKRKMSNQTKRKKLKKEFHYLYENIFSINHRGFNSNKMLWYTLFVGLCWNPGLTDTKGPYITYVGEGVGEFCWGNKIF